RSSTSHAAANLCAFISAYPSAFVVGGLAVAEAAGDVLAGAAGDVPAPAGAPAGASARTDPTAAAITARAVKAAGPANLDIRHLLQVNLELRSFGLEALGSHNSCKENAVR